MVVSESLGPSEPFIGSTKLPCHESAEKRWCPSFSLPVYYYKQPIENVQLRKILTRCVNEGLQANVA